MNRLAIYAALGVPEVWRYDGSGVRIYSLVVEEYEVLDRSPTFPFLSTAEILWFLELRKTMGKTSLIRSFREWVRSQIQSGG